MRGTARIAFLFLAGLMLSLPLHAQQRDRKLDALADQLAHPLGKSKFVKQQHGAPIAYLVFDFPGAGGRATQLGVHLADAFSDALAGRLPGLNPVDRARLRGLHRMTPRTESALSSSDWNVNPWLAARSLGANLVIQGTIDARDDGIYFLVRTLDQQSIVIASASQDLEWTEERRGWDKLPAVETPPPTRRIQLPERTQRAFSPPKCSYCPSPPYTEEARKAGFQGTVLLSVSIDEEGTVRDVSVARGLPYGLTEQAVAAVQNWRFKPALDADGKPIPYAFSIEVNFRLYERK